MASTLKTSGAKRIIDNKEDTDEVQTPFPHLSEENDQSAMVNRTDMPNEPQFAPMPHLADGGLLDSFSVDGGGSDTLKGLPMNPAAIPPPQLATDADPSGSGPKPAVLTNPSALTEKAQQSIALPGMPAGVTPDELERIINTSKEAYKGYGAGPQMDLSNKLLAQQHSPGMSLAKAGAGFADALMQGVARAGNPGFQKNLQDEQQSLYANSTSAMKNAHDTSLQDVNANMALDAKDPHSTISKTAQKAYASTLEAAGIPKQALPFMSADLIGDIGTKNITLMDDRQKMMLEQAYRMAGLDIQAAQLKATIANNAAQRRSEAAKALSGRGMIRRAGDVITGNPATKTLEDELTAGTTSNTFGTEAEAGAAGLQDGARVTIGGKTGTWRHK